MLAGSLVRHYVHTGHPNLTVRFNGLGVAQAAPRNPNMSPLNGLAMFQLHGQPDLTVHLNSLGVAQEAGPRGIDIGGRTYRGRTYRHRRRSIETQAEAEA